MARVMLVGANGVLTVALRGLSFSVACQRAADFRAEIEEQERAGEEPDYEDAYAVGGDD